MDDDGDNENDDLGIEPQVSEEREHQVSEEREPQVSEEREPTEDRSSTASFHAELDREGAAQLKASGFADGVKPAAYELSLLVGRTFPSWELFDAAIDDYEALSDKRLKRKTRNKTRFEAICRDWQKDGQDSCHMFITVRLMKKSGLVTVRKADFTHTCSKSSHSWRNGQNRTRWVSKNLMKHVALQHKQRLKTLQNAMVEFHHCQPRILSISRARKRCQEIMTGDANESRIASSFKETSKVPVPPVAVHELAMSDLARAPLLEKEDAVICDQIQCVQDDSGQS